MKHLYRLIFVLAFYLPWSLSVSAETQGRIILTITGDVAGGQIELDRKTLKKIGWQKITTENPFLEGPQTFEGTPLSDLLQYLEISSGSIKAIALDGYNVEIPVSDAFEREVLLAQDHNGKQMRIRNRGPVWVIYPMTYEETLLGDANGRMVWQLASLHITR